MKNFLDKKAFTLVELAIVIVIIGLLVGGVLQGQELIKQAKLRSFFAEHKGYISATILFNDKYGGLPGDITKGYSFFGGADCLNTIISYNNNGCNGNGDKVYNLDREGLLFWKHLSKAKLIKGSYTGALSGTSGTADCCIKPGVNVPPSQLSNGAYWLKVTNEALDGSTIYFPPTSHSFINNTNHFRYAQLGTGNGINSWPSFNLMSQVDAFAFDLKFDDGKAATGNIIGINGTNIANCWDTTTYEYNTALTTGGCAFALPFF